MKDYSSITPIEGGSKVKGKAYHDIPYFNIEGSSHRSDTKQRVDKITELYSVDGKTGLDLGCSVGGISFGLLKAGAEYMHGFDYDKPAVDLANDLAEKHKVNGFFWNLSIPSEGFWDAYVKIKPDFITWLSNLT